MTTPLDPEHIPVSDEAYSRPTKKSSGDWSAHIATTLERLAELLETLTDEQWEAQSLCDDWRVRDVVGHIVWRVGEANGTMMRRSIKNLGRAGFNIAKSISQIGIEVGKSPRVELIERLREIAAEKLQGHGRIGFIELTEAVVHTYDITEALELPIRLSPRSTGAVARVQAESPRGGKNTRIAKEHSLRATDARWLVGQGSPIDATAGEIIMHLFGRRSLV
ncbi:maleylpyruvate isomerase family mycothiol-dependent enzyme [Gulosibacter molinativorax]|uniref:maleylpyruvate isomerase family mycothiol-dependent enzyme n=1 Tax=Gulosibacter molinativorax TaxID=256821 RepID=UPI00146AABD3|nr:maleylpyruvate isomerase family mycothiol-dependent enzyme [Gulosibacter molinativorax]